MTSRYRAAQTRLERFEKAGPPPAQPREQKGELGFDWGAVDRKPADRKPAAPR